MIMSVLSWVCLTYSYLEPHKNNPLEKEHTRVLHNGAWRNYVFGEGLAKGGILENSNPSQHRLFQLVLISRDKSWKEHGCKENRAQVFR